MKLIFNNEEQMETFMNGNCPSDYGLIDSNHCNRINEDCSNCWKRYESIFEINTGLEVEDGIKVKGSKERYLIDIPDDGSYVDILGHKIYGNWNEGVDGASKANDSFINFCNYLARVDVMEQRLERLKKIYRNSINFDEIVEMHKEKGLLTPNDVLWLKGEEEIIEKQIHKPDLVKINLDRVKEAVGKLSESTKTVSFNLNLFPKVIQDEAIKKQEELQKKLKHLQALLDDDVYKAFEKHGYSKEWLNDINNIHRVEVFSSPYLGNANRYSKHDIFCVDGVELFRVIHGYVYTSAGLSCSHMYRITHTFKEN